MTQISSYPRKQSHYKRGAICKTCNGRCHDPLALHGGSRQAVGLCVLCHNPSQGIDPDTGNSVYFPTMIHKIHAGKELANGYTIIGFRQSVHDYSEVEYPAPLNDCEVCHTGGIPTGDFPLVANPEPTPVCDASRLGTTELLWDFPEVFDVHVGSADGPRFAAARGAGSKMTGKWVRDGTEFFAVNRATGETVQALPVDLTVLGCTGNAPGTFRGEAGTQHTMWLTDPSREVCGSCHDDVDFETGEGHSPFDFPVQDDDVCTICHKPSSGAEYDRSIKGAHTVAYKSNQLGGVFLKVEKVEFTGPGEFPTVTFSLSSKNGPLDPAKLSRLRMAIYGPNQDYDVYFQEDALAAVVKSSATYIQSDDATQALVKDGPYWTYTFANPIPMDAEGSYSLGVEGRISGVVINPGLNSEFTQNDQMQNFTYPFAVVAAAGQQCGYRVATRLL